MSDCDFWANGHGVDGICENRFTVDITAPTSGCWNCLTGNMVFEDGHSAGTVNMFKDACVAFGGTLVEGEAFGAPTWACDYAGDSTHDVFATVNVINHVLYASPSSSIVSPGDEVTPCPTVIYFGKADGYEDHNWSFYNITLVPAE